MYIGIDIGGTNVRIGTFDKKSPEKLIEKRSYVVDRQFEVAIKQIIHDIKEISGGKKIEGIGIGAPGLINSKEGYIESSANLKSWEKKPIGETLRKAFDTEVKVKNDAAVAAIGESLFGFGKDKEKFLYIIWGTGFGGAVVEKVSGKLKITSIEPGHQILDWDGPNCPCGQQGCVEVYIGGRNAEKYYGKPLAEIKDDKTWNDIAEKASHGILNTIMHHPVDLIVFGGGVINKQEHLLKRITNILDKRMTVFDIPKLTLAKHGEDSALYGSVRLFLVGRT